MFILYLYIIISRQIQSGRTFEQYALTPVHYAHLSLLPFHCMTVFPFCTHIVVSVESCNITQGRYKYTLDLMSLHQSNRLPSLCLCPPQRAGPTPPISKWLPFLQAHPDHSFAHYIAEGLADGFRIGYDPTNVTLHQSRRNHQSVQSNSNTVSEYLQIESHRGRINGPFMHDQILGVHCSPMGIIPKPHQPGKWRLIVDLSSPEGHSVNDGIPSDICSIQYASMDQAVEIVRALGVGTLLAKLDLKSAYRMVPVHPQDQWLLGMSWEDRILVDTCLPFGLRSAPKNFSAVADGLTWAMHCKGIE